MMPFELNQDTLLALAPVFSPGFWLFLPFWFVAVFIFWLFPDSCCGE